MTFNSPIWLWLAFVSIWLTASLYSLRWVEDYGRHWVMVQIHLPLTVPIMSFISVGLYCMITGQYVVR